MSKPYRSAPKAADWKAARERWHLSINQAAAILDIDPSTWRGWENGHHSGPGYGLRDFLRTCREQFDAPPSPAPTTLAA